MANVEISGDEDSSDDESVGKKDVEMKDADKASKPAADSDDDDAKKKDEGEKKPEKDSFGEEDSDDSDAKKKDDKPKEKAADDDDDLEDSDEGDVEFDDSNAVTGTSHSKGFQKKVSKKKSALDMLRENEEAEEAAARAETEPEVPKRPAPPKVDPRTMMVLEPDRPPSTATLHVTKLPNLVGIQPEAFEEATYSAKAEEEEYKGFVSDMIRWRYKKDKSGNLMRDGDGNLMRESNARIVQWEDGSYTLHVGKETLLVDDVDSSKTIGTADVVTGRTAKFAGLNGYLYLSQMAKYREEKKDDEEEEEEENVEIDKDGFKITPAGTVLECMGSVGSRLTARPSSLRSEAHKSLTVAVRKKTIKRAQIAEVVTQFDPEKQKEERIRTKDAIEKEKSRKRSGESYRRSRPRGMSSRYMDDDGDFDSTNLRAIKKRTMNYSDDEDDYGNADFGDDDDDDDEETFNRKRPRKRGVSKSVESDDEDDDDAPAAGGGKDDDDDDDDDDDVVTPVKSSKKRPQQAVFDDDDSD